MEPEPAPTHTGPPLELRAPRTLLEALAPPAAPRASLGTLLRPDDQVRLGLELVNGEIDAAAGTIVAVRDGLPIRLVVSFGPQHTVEATTAEADTPSTDAQGQRQAAPSRVSFTVPPGTPFTVATVLDLAAFALHLDGRADGGAGTEEPSAEVTAVELPASLVLSPTGKGKARGRFTAATRPVTHGDVTELWRARLGVFDGRAVVEPPAARPAVRAIWSRDGDPPFTRPVDEGQRDLLVEQSAGDPIMVDQLELSSQGASADLDGAWAAGVLAAYRQRVITGRDVRVEVVERGWLAPFGHRAALTTLTERVFEPDTAGDLTASLVQDVYLSISEPTQRFGEVEFMPFEGRRLPFLAVTAADPGVGPVGQDRVVLPNGSHIDADKACVLTRNGTDLAVSYTATDRTGRSDVTFALPAVFVSESEAYEAADTVSLKKTVLAKLATWYGAGDEPSRQELALGGQPIGWADPVPGGEAGSVQTTNRIRLVLDRPDLAGTDAATVEARLRELGRPAFYPGVDLAWIVDVASAITIGGAPSETEVTPARRWLDGGVTADNADLGYLDLTGEDPVVITPTTDARGMLSTDLKVDTYGQRRGAGTAPAAGDPSWDPAEALAGLPNLLGNLALAELVGRVEDVADELEAKGLPALHIEVRPGEGIGDPPVGVCFHFTWEPKLKSFPAEGEDPKTFVVTADFKGQDALADLPDLFDGEQTRAFLSLTTCLPENETTFEATLERFALQLPPALPPFEPVVAILFDEVRFTTAGGSSDVQTDIADWLFIGPLSWLEPIKDFVVEVLGMGAARFDGGIFVDYDIPIPGLTLGALTVDGLRVGVGVDLPDSGASSIDFSMCSRDDPFTITIMGFGGTGSFGLEVDARQIVLIEGSLAVTFELAVDLFIAQASVSAAVGVFVLYELVDEQPQVTLGAYAEIRGSVSVLGLFEVSGAVTAALLYNVTTKMLRGVAAVTGEVSSPFGKKEVTHDVEVEVDLGDDDPAARRLARGAGRAPDDAEPLSFRDRYSLSEWSAYCSAFAA